MPRLRVLLSAAVTQSRMELTYVIWARDKLVSHCVTTRAVLRLASERSSLQDSYFHVEMRWMTRVKNELVAGEKTAIVALSDNSPRHI